MTIKHKLGFISAHYNRNGSKSNYETTSLLDECSKYFDIEILDPHESYISFYSKDKNVINIRGKNVSDLDGLIVRSSKRYVKAMEIMIKALVKNGCFFLDSPGRHSGNELSKAGSSIKRVDENVGSNSHFIFSMNQLENFLEGYNFSETNKLICKPIDGSKGRDVFAVRKESDVLDFALNFFQNEDNFDNPLFLQSMIDIEKEYRIVVLGGKVLSSVRKTPAIGKVTANAATGGLFKEERHLELEKFVLEHVDNFGFLGVDAVVDKEGKYYVIEANRAPLYKTFENATGINVSECVAKYMFEQVSLNKSNINHQ